MAVQALRRRSLQDLVGQSSCIQALRRRVVQLGGCDLNVLLQGESGTGKDLVARIVHGLSGRRDRPYIAVNCAAIHETLLESELFGHEAGAFTGARESTLGFFRAADGGTVLLDEVGDMSTGLQSKLLRVLEERAVVPVGAARRVPVDVRVIAASNRDLAQAVEEGSFRLDLYYRLNTVCLSIPPLRQRREDIPPLIDHVLREVASALDLPVKTVSPAALAAMVGYDWPGNARQVANVIQRAYVLGRGPVIEFEDLTDQLIAGGRTPGGAFPTLKDAARKHVEEALKLSGGVRSRASKLLAIDRKSLWRLMRRYDIS